MQTILKIFTEFVTLLLFCALFCFVWPQGLWDPSFLAP